MPLTFMKKKKRIVSSTPPILPGTTPLKISPAPLAERIDALGFAQEKAAADTASLVAEIAKLHEKLAAKTAVVAKARESFNEALDKYVKDYDVEPAQPLTLYGQEFVVEIGKQSESREIIDMEAVKKALGQALFMQVATVRLGDVDKYLTLPQREALLKTNYGARKLNKVRRRS